MTEKSNKPPQVGEEVDVTIQSMAFGGEGVARYDNYVIFVPDVIPGEKARLKITAAKRSYGKGALVHLLEPSSDRIEPPCAVYGVCGGCQYQHVSYDKSLEFKEQQLKDICRRIGGLSVDDLCDPIRPAPEPYGYRNVISLHVTNGEEGWGVGYFARDNKTFVPISSCPIAREAINETLGGIGRVLSSFEHSDMIKEITIKYDGERVLFNPVYRERFRPKSTDRLCYRHQGLVFNYGLSSFFQVNHSVIPVLIDTVSEGLDGKPDETLFDLYAGVGLFSIALAGRFSRVAGIELARESVECFEENVTENKSHNTTIVQGPVERVFRYAYKDFKGAANSVLMDPPREGLKREVIQFLNKNVFRKLVYVSCDPATLARDLKSLEATYSIRKITPVDMFPQTKHIETVTILEKSAR
ncbi:MAG: class I SAM-dependent RNA methyltransferase [Candidatus Eisenbacteria bacterium]